MTDTLPSTETHPLSPFLPAEARLLMMGSFPPPRKRWSIDFFYPNLQNDMWRILGYIFRGDKNCFVDEAAKRFRRDEIIAFAQSTGLALYDTASIVRRLQGNASDKFLDIVEPTDIAALLRQLPNCRAVATTGQKATDTLCERYGTTPPAVGQSVALSIDGRTLRFYRMPSSSRAYPMKVERKAEYYRKMFEEIGMLPTRP